MLSVGAFSSSRVQRKRRRKPFPDEPEPELRVKDDDDDHESDKADPHASAISAPAPLHLDAYPKKCRLSTTTGLPSYCHHCRCNTRRPKILCTVNYASAGERCRKVYCVAASRNGTSLHPNFFHSAADVRSHRRDVCVSTVAGTAIASFVRLNARRNGVVGSRSSRKTALIGLLLFRLLHSPKKHLRRRAARPKLQ